ncbi:HSP-70 cofactor [Clostridium sp. N3C]|uniref:nucleotide exchange factor GrpE n=1 Tax=Clostridium sp. N3C TaxID=1776758 RepID=UPI00092DECA4|nr:nucleotide exchange factor GrpE [Clostridium sp. N3C]SCN21765.1 HSP-70 cofactor [Clostridium sp. N3C]
MTKKVKYEGEEKVTVDESTDNKDMNNENENETVTEAEVREDQEFEAINEEEVKSDETQCCKKLEEENKKLKDDLTRVSNELETLKDRLIRTTAEYENFRKRTAKEKEGIYTDACIDVLKNILPVADNLERALIADGSLEDMKKGIEMTLRQFKDALEKLGVTEIPTDGEFDPNLHDAMMHIEDENYGKNVIAEVFQKGYMRGDKVIRHSMVKVAN